MKALLYNSSSLIRHPSSLLLPTSDLLFSGVHSRGFFNLSHTRERARSCAKRHSRATTRRGVKVLRALKENSQMKRRRMLALTLALTLAALAAAACKGAGSSPTATYKAAYAAMKNKDTAGFKKVLSKKDLAEIEDEAKQANKSSDDLLKEVMNTFKLPKSDESKDEKVNGDNATLQVKNEKDEWETINFIKEDGAWKMK
jgi:putative heme iron utilization protein